MIPLAHHSQASSTSFGRLGRFLCLAVTVCLCVAPVCTAQNKSPQNKTVESGTKPRKSAQSPVVQNRSVEIPTKDQSQNVGYVHPPESTAAPTLHKDLAHPAPAPNEAPKIPFQKGVARPLPKQIPPGMYEEDTENLIRNWKNRRPMEDVKKAIQQSLAMPSEPTRQGVSASPEEQAKAAVAGVKPSLTTGGWEQIGYGDLNLDGVHHQAGRIRQASYAYDNQQGFSTLWLGATGGGLWRGVVVGLFAVAFVPMSDDLPGSPSVGAFLVQPGNSNNILIGTGDL